MTTKKKLNKELPPPAIPAKIDKNIFTDNECQHILKQALGPDVEGFLIEFSVYKELTLISFYGDYYILQLIYVTEASLTATHKVLKLLMKAMPVHSVDFKNFLEESGVFKKEFMIYSTVLPELRQFSRTKWCLDCYFIKENVIVLQNVVNLNYSHLMYVSFLYPDQMRSLLKGLASIHVSSIAYEIRNRVSIADKFKDALYEVTVSPLIAYWTVGVRAIKTIALQHPYYQLPKQQNFIRNELLHRLEPVYEMLNPSRKYFNVFCHRDPWGGNLFFSDNRVEDSSVFLDFQTCRYSPPAIDVLLALYLNIRPRHRKSVMSGYIEWYYECFATELHMLGYNVKDILSLEVFVKSCDEFKLCAAIYNCVASTIIHIPAEFLRDMKKNRPNDFHVYANIDRTRAIQQFVQSDEEFREHIFDTITDLMDVLGVESSN